MRDLPVQKWFTVVQRRQCAFLRILSNFARDGSIVSHQIEQGIVRPSLHKALEGHTISRRCAAAGCTHVQNLPGKPARGCFCSAFCPFLPVNFFAGLRPAPRAGPVAPAPGPDWVPHPGRTSPSGVTPGAHPEDSPCPGCTQGYLANYCLLYTSPSPRDRG